MKQTKSLVAFAALLMSVSAYAQNDYPRDLTGQFEITGKSVTDPQPGELQNTHMRLTLTGFAAWQLYLNMNVEPRYDDCLDDGSWTKTIKETECTVSADGRNYVCYFAINIQHQTIERGVVC